MQYCDIKALRKVVPHGGSAPRKRSTEGIVDNYGPGTGMIAMLRRRNNNANPLRSLVYVSDLKLQVLAEQIPVRVRRDIAAELKLDFKLVSLTLSSPAIGKSLPGEGRIAKLALVEEHMKRSGQIGGLDAKLGYFEALAEMDWAPLDEKTVLFCGFIDGLLLALGGSVSHLLGEPPTEAQIGSQPYSIRAAIHGAGAPRAADLGRDLLSAASAIRVTPQPVRTLASVIARGALPKGSPTKEYLLGTPIYVEKISELDPG